MAPLVVMLLVWVGFRLLGSVGSLSEASTWTGALRYAMAAMFLFTAMSHFAARTRNDLIRMVPPVFPAPGLLVTVTGILEFIGALGLLMPAPLSGLAALGLSALLIVMFPANIYAAQKQLTIAGQPTPPLAIRFPMQLFWIGALWWIARYAAPVA